MSRVCQRHNRRCHHGDALDLEKIKDKLGPDAPAMADDLIPKLKCAKCGGKQVGLIYSPDTTPNGKYGTAQAVRDGR
ncbi:hypothetical protein [Mesorhizobium sp. NZP2077]|uniref:hypothetical protein n=1 Tax=Mesorhizobium sp. NZP2077 TaxID=2483404 RepID=UPI0015522D2F|nr:hypothetical protein [Mesorhizobium sp. NZP2077]QKC83297.1 hypothetical protein EB232_18220 [Mesorhizobium sp. NZP2077]QKD16813.1 hypothetical protein HGP13_18000 [Mesorhizobium sp. NZP2077]